MHSKFLIPFALPFVTLLSACQEDEAKTAFKSQCAQSVGADKAKICGCIYDGLEEDFTPEQLTRISRLFSMSIPQSVAVLNKSKNEAYLDIARRVNEVETVTEACFKSHG